MKVIIAGEGKTLYFLCRSFTDKGYEVTIINPNKEESVQLARQLPATVLCGNGSDAKILREAGAMGADIVLAITPRDQDNLVICQLASVQFEVPRVMALAHDPDNAEIFRKMGIPAFSTTNIVSSLIEQRASLEQVVNLAPVAEGRVNVTEILLDNESPVAGKYLREIDLPDNVLVAVVIRGETPIVPRGDNELREADRVILITMPENHGAALRVFTGAKG